MIKQIYIYHDANLDQYWQSHKLPEPNFYKNLRCIGKIKVEELNEEEKEIIAENKKENQ